MSVNIVIIEGRLGRDPELRRTNSGDAVTNLSVATTEKYTKDGQKVEETTWHNVVVWNKPAEIIAQYFKKGDGIFIQGKLRVRSWDDNGQKREKAEIVASTFAFPEGKRDGGGISSDNAPAPQIGSLPDDDDLPF